jgi:hypothetical protein
MRTTALDGPLPRSRECRRAERLGAALAAAVAQLVGPVTGVRPPALGRRAVVQVIWPRRSWSVRQQHTVLAEPPVGLERVGAGLSDSGGPALAGHACRGGGRLSG